MESERNSVVAPAPRSKKAKVKEAAKRTEEDWPVHSFQTLLEDMGTLCRNLVRVAGSTGDSFVVKTQPTKFQAHVFELAGIRM